MPELLFFVAYCIKLYMWVFIIDVILSWLVSLNVINTSSHFVYLIGTALRRLTNPVLQPIRRRMPNLGGIDVSPVIAILGLVFLRDVVVLGWLMRILQS
ncbi:MAG: YggT family protein [Alphaproteobacteria bacterium]